MKLIPAAERPKRSQSPCPTNRNQHRQTVLLVEFNSRARLRSQTPRRIA